MRLIEDSLIAERERERERLKKLTLFLTFNKHTQKHIKNKKNKKRENTTRKQ